MPADIKIPAQLKETMIQPEGSSWRAFCLSCLRTHRRLADTKRLLLGWILSCGHHSAALRLVHRWPAVVPQLLAKGWMMEGHRKLPLELAVLKGREPRLIELLVVERGVNVAWSVVIKAARAGEIVLFRAMALRELMSGAPSPGELELAFRRSSGTMEEAFHAACTSVLYQTYRSCVPRTKRRPTTARRGESRRAGDPSARPVCQRQAKRQSTGVTPS
jgi:hypothetical protein